MITTINNDARVFQIVRLGFFTRQYFCNLEDIPTILKNELEPHDEFQIYENWNFKMKRCTKKFLNEMFAANQIDYKI